MKPKNEKQFQTMFEKWAENNWRKTFGMELKYAKGGTFNIKGWINGPQGHQARNLLKTKKGFLIYKISDESSGKKVFDCFALYKEDATLNIFWEKHNDFTIIAIEKLLPYFTKSIKYDEAVKISDKHGTL